MKLILVRQGDTIPKVIIGRDILQEQIFLLLR